MHRNIFQCSALFPTIKIIGSVLVKTARAELVRESPKPHYAPKQMIKGQLFSTLRQVQRKGIVKNANSLSAMCN